VNQTLEDAAISRLGDERKPIEPCSIIIFGASGDLTARKLIPAFYHLFKEKRMPADFRIVGFARREKTDSSWRTELRQALDQFSRTKPVDDNVWQVFSEHISYCRGDITETEAYEKLERQLTATGSEALRHNLLFYLATSPSQFGEVVEQLHRCRVGECQRADHGCRLGWRGHHGVQRRKDGRRCDHRLVRGGGDRVRDTAER